MPYFLSPFGNQQAFDANGNPLVGGSWRTFRAGTSTPETTYTSQAGTIAQGTTMTLDSLGLPVNGPVWMLNGIALKFRLFNAAGVLVDEWDNISGIGDVSVTPDEWVLFAATPTYVSPTVFTVAGDQTNTFQVGRRIKSINTGGASYGTILTAVFGTSTTVTLTNTSGVLDAGLSSVSYGFASVNPSLPNSAAVRTTMGVAGLDMFAGYKFGSELTPSAGNMTVSAGRRQSSDGLQMMVLASALTKTTAAWAAGTAVGGRLGAAAIAANTSYDLLMIYNPTTLVTEFGFDLPGVVTFPAGFTKSRRLLTVKTNASSQWPAFEQIGSRVILTTPGSQVAVNNPGIVDVTRTLASVPTGIRVLADLSIAIQNSGSAGTVFSYHSDLSTTAIAATATQTDTGNTANAAGASVNQIALKTIRTNASGQIRSNVSFSDASVSINVVLFGWTDIDLERGL